MASTQARARRFEIVRRRQPSSEGCAFFRFFEIATLPAPSAVVADLLPRRERSNSPKPASSPLRPPAVDCAAARHPVIVRASGGTDRERELRRRALGGT